MKALFISISFLLLISCGVKEKQSRQVSFKKHILYDQFVTEGIATGDVNHDGLIDILSGPFWFEAPDWTRHEIRPVKTFDITKGWSDSFLNFSLDVNKDGWIDFVRIDFPGTGAYWYENPQNESGHWKEYLFDSTACNESPMLTDLDEDGSPELIFGSGNKEMKWFKLTGDSTFWESHSLSAADAPGTHRFSHGLGSGDINGDGRNDVMVVEGWWEAPEDRTHSPWVFHKTALGEPCAQMHTYDFDADGDNDVISSSAHNYGIWWHEQIKDHNGEISFVRHLIDSSFSQTHGAALADINADGLPDLITGKRFFAHNGKDPGGMDPQVIYWFELKRDEQNKPYWTPHLIDDSSGVGLQVIVEDINGNGIQDILIANKKGIFYFEGQEVNPE
ncbi:MAG: VCBS repeat-containing protein [Cyclobacteriaceae bacterium]|tara:strand:- start:24656 stop:25825 length:1170 start_codon:yes stop_codon:yes gene_type:complete